ncbi:hypothetical protein GOP47_0017254 [Adiantum capillus-veneris]|uniref:Uncharacterized protein n=1 Tax=Adiantum capillus-veneris TaxID=13818 RepID=A0A9D4UJZ4_ADICA|nr:hypothetical protein GOP47_0017254 [Adiantum capillus-veneris]
MFSIAHGCPLLRVLDMSCCSSITDKGIDVLLSKCVDMREFSVPECNIKGWGFRHGKFLEKLTAIECCISDAGLVEVLQGATCLRMLDLSHNQGSLRLSSIGECCRELESLNLTWSSTLDDVALETIAEGCTNLRVLNVSWCHYHS